MIRGTRYSVGEGRWYGARPSASTAPKPPCDDREFRTDFGGGLIRVDLGEPVARLPGEPQPVAVKAPKGSPEVPADNPSVPEALPEATRRTPSKLPAFKPGLGKG